MLLIDFMTPSMCDDLIEISNDDGEWGNLSYDKFPAKEIRLKKLDLWDDLEKHWENFIYPIIGCIHYLFYSNLKCKIINFSADLSGHSFHQVK